MSNHPRYAAAKNHKITMSTDTDLTDSLAVGSHPAPTIQHPSSLAAPSINQPPLPSPAESGCTNPPMDLPFGHPETPPLRAPRKRQLDKPIT